MRSILEQIFVPHVIGIKKDIVEETKMIEPNQSNLLTFANRFPGVRVIFKNRMIATAPDTMMGILIQKIHLQETSSAKARGRSQTSVCKRMKEDLPPPINGPPTLPIAQILPVYTVS